VDGSWPQCVQDQAQCHGIHTVGDSRTVARGEDDLDRVGACGGVDGFQSGETYQLAIRQPTVPSVEGVMADAPLLAKRKDRQSTRLLLSDQPTPILKPLLPHSLTLSRFASEEKCGSSDAYK
jgi:hypothetical protein